MQAASQGIFTPLSFLAPFLCADPPFSPELHPSLPNSSLDRSFRSSQALIEKAFCALGPAFRGGLGPKCVWDPRAQIATMHWVWLPLARRTPTYVLGLVSLGGLAPTCVWGLTSLGGLDSMCVLGLASWGGLDSICVLGPPSLGGLATAHVLGSASLPT